MRPGFFGQGRHSAMLNGRPGSPRAAGTVKKYAQKGLQAQVRMKSAGNGGVVEGSLQMLHIHVLFVAPLGAGHMTESGTDQHRGGPLYDMLEIRYVYLPAA